MNPNEAIRDARKLGLPRMLVLGVQHLFAMFGATILVPILVQGYGLPLNIQTTLFFAGVGTLFFHACSRFEIPAFLGSSFAFLGGYMSMANMNEGMYATISAEEKLAYAGGGIVVAGLMYLILALIIKLVGVKTVMRFLPPVVTGPIIVCIGLTLAPSAVSNASTCWPLALIALATIVIFNVWGKGMFKIIPILMGVVVSYIAALIMNACGGIVVAGLLYVILAAIIKAVGVHKVMRFLPPVVTGPIIILIGLNLAPSAVANASSCWWLALLSIAVIVVANIWGKGMIKIIPILLGVVIPYAVAVILTLVGVPMIDFSGAKDAAFIGFQPFVTDFSGSIAKFDITSILVMAPIAIAAMMEHVGDMSAISATVGKPFIQDPGLHRTLIGDGIATSLSAMFGGPANTTYGENTGVLVLSRVYDPKVVRLAAIYAIILSFSPWFAAIINSIPGAIIGGVSFILYGMISAIGVRNVVENRVDFTNSRNLIIAAVILVCGLGFSGGLTFVVGGASITLTSLAIAAIAGIVLNAILPGNDYEFGKDDNTDTHAGDLGRY